jgi:hypothetical protein
MPEHDAFGRPIGEGGESLATPAPESPSTPAPEGPSTPTPAPSGLKLSGRPSRFSGGVSVGSGWVAVLVFVVVIGSGGLIAWQAIDDTKDAIRSFRPSIPKLPTFTVDTDSPNPTVPESPEVPQQEAPPPTGLGPRSLIRRAAFAKAMSKIRNSDYGEPTYVRVAADRVDAQRIKGGRLRTVQVGYDGELRTIGPASGPGFKTPSIPFSDIETAAPERLVRGGVRRGGVKAGGIDYLVVSNFSNVVVWNAYFKNNVRYQGDQAGRVERKF